MKWIDVSYIWGREMLLWFRTSEKVLYKTKLGQANDRGVTGNLPSSKTGMDRTQAQEKKWLISQEERH